MFFAGGKSISPITPFGVKKQPAGSGKDFRLDSNLPLKHRPSINSLGAEFLLKVIFTLYKLLNVPQSLFSQVVRLKNCSQR